MKTCRTCGETKPLDEFFKDRTLPDGHANHCKACKQKQTHAWRCRNRDKYNAYMRRKNKDRYPQARLQRYGVTDQWFQKTLSDQGHKCAICRKSNSSQKRAFAVDHHHGTGKVRGILCYNCNRLLHAFDNVALHAAIVAYLEKHKGAIIK